MMLLRIGTSDIIQAYAEKYPGNHLYAVCVQKKIFTIIQTPRKFIAEYMEKETPYYGESIWHFAKRDDFWIDCSKLRYRLIIWSHIRTALCICIILYAKLNCRNGAIKAGNPYKEENANDRILRQKSFIMQYNGYPSTASFLFKENKLTSHNFFAEVHANDYTTTLMPAFATGSVHYSSRIMLCIVSRVLRII